MAKPLATTGSKAADPQVAVARQRARRTAWMVAGVALAVYLAFLVLGMGGYVR
ncbi:MAG: hypothetical protein JSR63_02285 [Proteobacteria bacterium]|nr:hypothetical protein [Pseudomonadota bacterium]